jgi:hypothetical protein
MTSLAETKTKKKEWYYIIYSTGEIAGRVPDNDYLWKGGCNWIKGKFTKNEAERFIKRTNKYRISKGWKEEVFYINKIPEVSQ